MKMKKSQFREDTATYIQMIHLLNEYNPGWKIILIGVLLEGIFPFIAIFLSSMLLDALYSGRSMQEMALFVLAGTGASFVTAILRHLVTKKKNIMWWPLYLRCSFTAARIKFTILTPGISTGYWKLKIGRASCRERV